MLSLLLQSMMTTVVNTVINISEGLAQWGQAKTKSFRQKIDDKYNVFREDEYTEDIVETEPKQLQVPAVGRMFESVVFNPPP